MMTQETVLEELIPIFREVLKVPELELHMSDSANSIDRWDSLNNAVLMAHIQKHFGVRFSIKDVLSIRTVSDICQLIIQQG